MSSLHPALANWWQSDRKILYLFALYGLAAGIMSYVASLSYDDHFMDGATSAANFPAILTLFYMEWNVANPNGFSIFFHPIMIIVGSMAVWSFIGLLIYSLVKMLRMGP
jgi:hypothetical protein